MLHPRFMTAGGPAHHRIRSSNPVTSNYRKMTRPIWPIVDNPHGMVGDTQEKG
ncbi:hypothetical protein [Marinobacterium rhizophilum]|uniref:Uncharacterized protein n=1 Tax=Marinobacterium rhizophilum TaxID=420402 RepID=A0ABY5HJ81_9GAMM|nr:hypothetical protein [Marinobacterium rhizophilum]UTW11315.1 hypothetical protein KDW95_18925 [Marinobacterium rhizophilum]